MTPSEPSQSLPDLSERVALLVREIESGKAWGTVLLPLDVDGEFCGATFEEAEEALCVVVDRLRAENEALQRRLKVMAREVSERLDWIVRDRREPDKVLANVSTTRSVLIRELALGSVETDEQHPTPEEGR